MIFDIWQESSPKRTILGFLVAFTALALVGCASDDFALKPTAVAPINPPAIVFSALRLDIPFIFFSSIPVSLLS
jgi:hypothetical protein